MEKFNHPSELSAALNKALRNRVNSGVDKELAPLLEEFTAKIEKLKIDVTADLKNISDEFLAEYDKEFSDYPIVFRDIVLGDSIKSYIMEVDRVIKS